MKVLVTGGAGFIGSHIVNRLAVDGYDVVVVDNLSTGDQKNIDMKVNIYKEDITNGKNMREIFKNERPEFVIHQAAQINVQQSILDPNYDSQVNVLGTINLLECCREYNVKKFIFASSAAVYGDPDKIPTDVEYSTEPISFYGVSKLASEYYIKTFSRMYGFKYSILRYSNVFGPKQNSKGESGVIAIFVDKYLKSETPTIFGDGEQTRDFIYVDDVVQANVNALSRGDNGIFNVSLNNATTLNNIVDTLNDITNKKLEPIYCEERKGDIRHSRLDNRSTILKLNWFPKHNLYEGLKATYDYYRKTSIK
jgi:UDP-glucose 4-epimerase